MVHNKRKKSRRFRGDTTHGYGSMKKHRGTGNKGGKGNAGSGKRADSKKPTYQKIKDYYGKHGFKMKGVEEKIIYMNIEELNKKIDLLVTEKKAVKQGDIFAIDLETIGVNKLLGKGTPDRKYKINVKYATAKALEKIKSSGEIIVKNVENNN